MDSETQRSMRIIFRRMILSSHKLRDEVMIAFGLIILTLLVLIGYLFPGVASFFEERNFLPVIIGIIATIFILGILIIVQIIEPLIKITHEAKAIAKGDLTREIQLARQDELGELGEALNSMTLRIRNSVEELKTLSSQTETLNAEINSRIAMLSDMMEISSCIAQSATLDEVLAAAAQKCFLAHGQTLCCVILRDPLSEEFKIRHLSGAHEELLKKQGIMDYTVELGHGLVGKTILKKEPAVLDKKSELNQDAEIFRQAFKVRNAIVVPIASKGTTYGVLIAGNEQSGFEFPESQRDLVQLVSKHIAIAILNNMLSDEVEKFELTDGLTGLYNNTYTRNRLAKEVHEAINFQKSCSFILLRIDKFNEYHGKHGHIEAEYALIKIANLLRDFIEQEYPVSRFGDHEYAVILPNRSKKEAIAMAENFLKRVDKAFEKVDEPDKRLTVSAAVVENPIDGMEADELILKSGVILTDTTDKGGHTVGYQ